MRGLLIQRKDDTPETVLERLKVYHKETAPLAEFYAKRGVLKKITAKGSVEEINAAILDVLESVK